MRKVKKEFVEEKSAYAIRLKVNAVYYNINMFERYKLKKKIKQLNVQIAKYR